MRKKEFEYYRPELGFVYPDRCDEHMINVPHRRDVVVDENYPFVNKKLWFKLLRAGYWLIVNGIAFWLLRITHGLKIYGRKNLRKNRAAFKNGAVTVSNHVFYWDYLCVLKSIRPYQPFFPAWQDNLEGPNGPLIRISRGVPIPAGDIAAMKQFKRTMDGLFEAGKWIHFYPEGSMWMYYPDIRPIKKAVFTYAVKYDRPVIPITMSYRRRRGITRLFTDFPQVDLHMSEPLFADKSLSPKEAAADLQRRAYHIMQEMNGIHPGDANYNTDLNPDNYRKTV